MRCCQFPKLAFKCRSRTSWDPNVFIDIQCIIAGIPNDTSFYVRIRYSADLKMYVRHGCIFRNIQWFALWHVWWLNITVQFESVKMHFRYDMRKCLVRHSAFWQHIHPDKPWITFHWSQQQQPSLRPTSPTNSTCISNPMENIFCYSHVCDPALRSNDMIYVSNIDFQMLGCQQIHMRLQNVNLILNLRHSVKLSYSR